MSGAGPASVWATGVWLVLVAGYAVLSTVWAGHDPGWYVALARPSSGLVLVPYAGWLSVATALSVQYSRLN